MPAFETELIELGEKSPRDAATNYRFEIMGDMGQATNALIRVFSSLTHAGEIQLIGHIHGEGNDENGIVTIGSPRAIGAGNTTVQLTIIHIHIAEEWYPFLGISFASLTQPTDGTIRAEMLIRNALSPQV